LIVQVTNEIANHAMKHICLLADVPENTPICACLSPTFFSLLNTFDFNGCIEKKRKCKGIMVGGCCYMALNGCSRERSDLDNYPSVGYV